MIRFSEGRLSHLAHQIVKTLRAEGLAEVENERLALQEIKRALDGQREREAKLDEVGHPLPALHGGGAPQAEKLSRPG